MPQFPRAPSVRKLQFCGLLRGRLSGLRTPPPLLPELRPLPGRAAQRAEPPPSTVRRLWRRAGSLLPIRRRLILRKTIVDFLCFYSSDSGSRARTSSQADYTAKAEERRTQKNTHEQSRDYSRLNIDLTVSGTTARSIAGNTTITAG